MNEIISNFHFIRPWLLLLLFVPLVFYGLYFGGINAQSSWQKVVDERLLEYLLVKGSALKRRLMAWLALLGLAFAVVAAAGPSWQKVEVPSYAPQNPVMVLLNLSSDMAETDLAPSRLRRAKYKIKDFLEMLQGVQVGLEVYSSEPFVIAPLTDDANILANLLPAVDLSVMPANGDRLDRAVDLAVSRIKSAGYKTGRLVVFAPDAGQKFDLAVAAAKKANAAAIKVDIIGVTASNNEKLALIAQAGGGKYWNLQTDDSKIKALADMINAENGALEKSKNQRSVWLDAGWYLLAVPMLCCLMFFRKGILAIAFVLMSSNAYAGFFLNDNQEGLRAFNGQNYVEASRRFNDANWQGASFYRAGDYQKAFDAYKKDNSAEGMYNQGNALAKGGKIDEAIAKYEAVLTMDENHEDAKFNLEYLKRQKQQQQQNQNDNRQDKDDNEQNRRQQNQEQDEGQAQQDKQDQDEQSQGNDDSDRKQEQNADRQEDGQQDKNSDAEDDNAQDERLSSMDELDENGQNDEGKMNSGAVSKQAEDNEEYDEKMQAKMQQYRDIPEDAGGLLKAFIYQEYRQNRYKEE